MKDENGTAASRKVHFDNLDHVVQFCENKVDCRRVTVLQYFGETFNRNRCGEFHKDAVCDCCRDNDVYERRDVTEDARIIVDGVHKMINLNTMKYGGLTVRYLVQVYRGAKVAKIESNRHHKVELYGKGAAYSVTTAERLFHKLISDGFLKLDIQKLKNVGQFEPTVSYVAMGPNAKYLFPPLCFQYPDRAKVLLDISAEKKDKEEDKTTESQQRALDETQRCLKEIEGRCFEKLREVSKELATEFGIPNASSVYKLSMLQQMAQRRPITKDEMMSSVDGVTQFFFDTHKMHRLCEAIMPFFAEAELAQVKFDDIQTSASPRVGANSGNDSASKSTPHSNSACASASNTGRSPYFHGAASGRLSGCSKRAPRSRNASNNSSSKKPRGAFASQSQSNMDDGSEDGDRMIDDNYGDDGSTHQDFEDNLSDSERLSGPSASNFSRSGSNSNSRPSARSFRRGRGGNGGRFKRSRAFSSKGGSKWNSGRGNRSGWKGKWGGKSSGGRRSNNNSFGNGSSPADGGGANDTGRTWTFPASSIASPTRKLAVFKPPFKRDGGPGQSSASNWSSSGTTSSGGFRLMPLPKPLARK